MIRLKVKLSKHGASGTLRLLFLLGSIISSHLEAATTVYPLSYSARLTDGNGSPLEGPVDVDVKFFATESSTTLLGQNFFFTGVALNQGVLTLSINMMDSQVAAVFGDGSEAVYIELTAGGKTYPRQRYSFVPLALRVPIDQKTLSFDPNGKLGISLKTQPGTNQFLTKNANGELTWGSPAVVTASSIQGKTVSSTQPQAGQILTYSGSEWIPQTPVNGSGSGTLSVGQGGTGATSFTNNGVLIGAGAGPISATAAGTQENVLKVGASGPEFGKVNLASSDAVTGKLTLANGGTGSDLAATGGSGQYVKQSTSGGPLSVGTIEPADITTALVSMLATATASGTGPGWSASGNTHTLSIPMASNAGVAAGLLSNGDYATFASKVGSVSAGTGITASPSGSSVTLGLDTAGTAGTYVKVTTDAYGRVVSGATLSTSDLPPLTAMVGADGNAAGKAGAVPAPAATDDGKFLRGDGTWSTPPATAGGTANEIQYNSGGTLTGNSSFVYAAGNVGIGTTSPGAALDVVGQIKIQGGSPGVGKVLTSDADGLATWSTAAVGSITGVTAGTGLTGGGTSGFVMLNADVGTTANKLVQLDASAKLPAVDGSALTNISAANLSTAVSVTKGGTGLTSGTSGGIPYFNAASTMASSSALTANGVVLGGGAGAAPTSTAAGAANSVLRVPSGGGAPSFGAIEVSQSNAVTGTLNLGNGGTGASLLLTGGTGQYLKQSASGAALTVGTIAPADLPTMVGDSGSGGTKGVVPAPASGDTAAGKFLRADGSWSVPAGTTNWAVPGSIGSTAPNTGAFTTLTASGNVGIGTTTPGSALDVNGIITSRDNVTVGYQSGSSGGVFITKASQYGKPSIQAVTSGFDGDSLLLNPVSGNVGIGTTAPNDKLQVVGNISGDSLSVGPYLTGYNAGIELGNSSAASTTPYLDFHYGTGSAQDYNTRIMNSANNLLIFTNGVGTPLSLNGANVGIGTTVPAAQLQVGADGSDGRVYVNGGGSSTNPLTTARPTNDNANLIIGRPNSKSADAGGIEFISSPAGSGWGWKLAAPDMGSGTTSFHIHSRADSGTWSERLTITNSGNVGIGTTSPATVLNVRGTGSDTATYNSLRIDNPDVATAGTTNGLLYYWNTIEAARTAAVLENATTWATGLSFSTAPSNTGATEKMRITSAGNVGIGTTNPGYSLDVAGQARASIINSNNGTAPGGMWHLGMLTNGISRVALGFGGTESGSNSGSDFQIWTYGDSGAYLGNPLTIKRSSGNVGIGTTAPAGLLSVVGTGGVFLNAGNVGIGVTSSPAQLSIAGGDGTNLFTRGTITLGYGSNGSFPHTIHTRHQNSGSGNAIDFYTNDGSDNSYPSGSVHNLSMVNGKVGVGTTSPSYTLHVNGSVAGNGAYIALSDIRFKKDVQDLVGSLAKVLAIRGVSYKWIDEDKNGRGTQYGVIAQEIEKILPDVVVTGSDGVKRVKYDDLIPLIIEALKAEKASKDAEIAQLKAESAQLKSESAQLKASLCEKFPDLSVCRQ